MLSYIVPVEEKPITSPKSHMQLALSSGALVENQNGTTTDSISKETSVSSFISDLTTATASSVTPSSASDKSRPKLIINGAKHQHLKRVSFGSSKGSMVETLIFESPLQEDPVPSPIPEDAQPDEFNNDQNETEREKVRVSFFQQSKPQEVDLPDEPVDVSCTDFDLVMMASPVPLHDSSNHMGYNRTESTESGWDNPFRPGGDLSREADEIVELIKGGKPITPTPGSQPATLHPSYDYTDNDDDKTAPLIENAKKINDLGKSPSKNQKNGTNVKDQKTSASPPGAVDVKRGTTLPEGDASQVERVTIKKKPKCKCCVIQ